MDMNWNGRRHLVEALLMLGMWVCSGIPAASAADLPTPETEAPAVVTNREVTLDDVLMFVVDRVSADAAAPSVKQRLSGAVSDTALSEYDRALLGMTNCFGSEALQEALRPVLAQENPFLPEALRPYERLLTDLTQAMDDLSAVLESVRDKASADRAAEMVENFRPYVLSLSSRAEKLSEPPSESYRRMTGHLLTELRPRVARLLMAWGQLKLRSDGYYDSSRLQSALPELSEVLENMDMPMDPATIGEVSRVASAMEPLLREWLNLARGVRDKASADAAAPRLQQLAQRLRALCSESLGQGYEHELCMANPQVELLMQACDRVSHHFAGLRPAFFGSPALGEALRHEED